MHRGEPNPGAFELASNRFCFTFLFANLDLRRRPLRCELPGIAQEILQHHAEQARSACNTRPSRTHARKIVASLIVELARVVGEQGFAEPVYRPQGSPEIVGHRIAEGLQLVVGSFELARPLTTQAREFQVRLNPCEQLAGGKRLDEIVVCPSVEAFEKRLLSCSPRQ